MVVAEINSVCYGSTGKIMLAIQDLANSNLIDTYCFYAIGATGFYKEKTQKIGTSLSNRISGMLAHFTGLMGSFSFFQTIKLIRRLKTLDVDVIHLHNIHVSFLNYDLFFCYVKRNKINIVWTLHDCWTFTGHCPHYSYQKCSKWQIECHHCPRYKEYPISSFDNSKVMYRRKRRLFSNLSNVTLVVPSDWLKKQVQLSYMKNHKVVIINNGIDLNIFKPTQSNFRSSYGINNRYIILGVAFGWDNKKGLDIFIELANRLPQDEYQIVLVGTNDNIDKQLPSNIISIQKTQDQVELAKIYTAADLFVNPTREDNYPTVNMESIACGTPVLTFETGGSPEIVDNTCGFVVACDDIDSLTKETIRICNNKPYSQESCIKRAKSFDVNKMLQGYIDLYKEIINERTATS